MKRARWWVAAAIALAMIAYLSLRDSGRSQQLAVSSEVASHEDIHPAANRPVAVTPTAVPRENPKLASEISIRGRLVSARTGEAIAPGEVRLLPLTSPQVPDSFDIPAAKLLSVDGEGRFAASQLTKGSYWLEASAPGYARDRRAVQLPARDELLIRLNDSSFLAGEVVESDGSPAAGAHVVAISPLGTVEGEASAGGAFSLEVSPGTHTLTAERGGRHGRIAAPIEVGAGQSTHGLRIVLDGKGTLAVRVRDGEGHAIANASVELHLEAGGRRVAQGELKTDGEGRCAWKQLSAGRYVLWASAKGHAGEEARVAIGETRASVEMVLRASAALEGRVLTRTGNPIAGAHVAVADRAATSDENGHYFLDELSPGDAVVSAQRGNEAIGTSRAIALVAGQTLQTDLTLGGPAHLHGVVHYRGGGAVDRPVRITASGTDGSGGGESDAAGNYAFDLNPGDYKVGARLTGWVNTFSESRSTPITLGEDEDVALDLALPQDGPDDGIHGLVLEPGGAPSIRPFVTAVIDGQGQRNFRGREDGTFDMPGPSLDNGAVIHLYAKNGGRTGEITMNATNGNVTIQLGVAATVLGDVRRDDHQQVGIFTLQLTNPGSVFAFLDQALQLEGASFLLDDVAPGALHAAATADDGAHASADLQVAAASATKLSLLLQR